ncbi:MAG: peptidoglycan-binding protein [Clostridiales bacterium]|nr:peptidoglycan-binding protein [Clostridiales bacterium]
MKRIIPTLLVATITLGLSIFMLNSFTSDSTPVDNDSLHEPRQLVTESISESTEEENENEKIEEVDINNKEVSVNNKVKVQPSNVSRGSSSRLDNDKKPQPSETKDKKQQTKASRHTEEDLDLLARLITAEAQLEPYEAKVAVGAVVMNRVKSKEFPNTIKEVIYQNIDGYPQFTPVVNGWINKPSSAESKKAAKEALNGRDPTNGALYYYDNTSTSEWLRSRQVSVKFSNMIYAY